jgi:hypothetical protein
MAPTEQGGEANKQEQQPKLGSLTAVEQVVNQYAMKFANRYRIGEEKFTINLVTQFKGVMGLKRGPVVQIILLWPDAQPNINTLLESAFKTISRNRLIDGMQIEPIMHIKRRAEERRKWLREKIGDEADIILDLIPKHRIVTAVTTTVEYRDVVTGESLTVTHKAKPEQYRGTDIGSWLRLSRMVRDNHPAEATRYTNDDAELPELDEARELLAAHAGNGTSPVNAGRDDGTDAPDRGCGRTEGDLRDDGEEHDARNAHQVAG